MLRLKVWATLFFFFFKWLNNSLLYEYIYIYHIFFIHSLMDIWVVFNYQLLWVMTLWKLIPKFFVGRYVFPSLGYTPTSGTAESYGNFMFNPLRNCQTIFQSGCTISHSPHQCVNFLPSVSCSLSCHVTCWLCFPFCRDCKLPEALPKSRCQHHTFLYRLQNREPKKPLFFVNDPVSGILL